MECGEATAAAVVSTGGGGRDGNAKGLGGMRDWGI